jgi:hypothetical protein
VGFTGAHTDEYTVSCVLQLGVADSLKIPAFAFHLWTPLLTFHSPVHDCIVDLDHAHRHNQSASSNPAPTFPLESEHN